MEPKLLLSMSGSGINKMLAISIPKEEPKLLESQAMGIFMPSSEEELLLSNSTHEVKYS